MEAPRSHMKTLKMKMNLFLCNNKLYFLFTDYYSTFPWVEKLSATSTKDVISALSFCFSVLGTPEEEICDRGIHFTSKEYKEFATQ